MASRETVLIGFAGALSAPEVAWSLVDAGFHVVAFARQGGRPALARSRLVDVVEVTDPGLDVLGALDDIRGLVQRHPDPIIMPLDDASLWLVNRLSEAGLGRVAGPMGLRAEVALDKRRQIELATAAGFHVPATIPIERADDLSRVESFPAIIKPALAARVAGRRLVRGAFSGIADNGERAHLATNLDFSEPYLAQPMIHGTGEGVFGIARRDRVTHWFGHSRVRMMNPIGSGSSACEPRLPDADTRQYAERFLTQIGWTGLFMIELLRDRAGKPWFMELNGRPWGSMALARRLGLEYPAWAVEALLDDRFEPPEVSVAEEPLVCRNLGRELLHVAFVFRGPRSRTFTEWPSRASAVRDVFQIRQNHAFYNWRRGDTNVFWADTWNTVRSPLVRRKRAGTPLVRKATRRFERTSVRREQRARRRDGSVRALIPEAKQILVVCYGNINRSALAERHLQALLPELDHVSSCGFHVPDGRPADPEMCRLAERHGIDLSEWSSSTIDLARVESADVILAMEAKHLVRLREEYPSARDRAFLLSCVTEAEDVPLEIRDPFGRHDEDYQRCIAQVTAATRALAELIPQEA